VTGRNPDAIAYEPVSQRVFTFNAAAARRRLSILVPARSWGPRTLGGRPEFAVADGRGRIYVNIEDKSELAALDARTLTVQKRWSLAPCEEPSGLAMDRAQRRLFSVCSNGVMAVSDADSGRVLATLPIGAGVDGAAFDRRRGSRSARMEKER